MHAQWWDNSQGPLDTTPPAAVTNLKAQTGDGQATLRWTDPPDSDFNRVEITANPQTGSGQAMTVDKGVQSRTLTGLTNGITYTFTIVALDTAGNRSDSVSVAATPRGTGDGGPLTSIDAIREYLSTASGGESADNPIPLATALVMPDNWNGLITEINYAGKYVDLDMSAWTMSAASGGVFDPSVYDDVRYSITALTLPDGATSMANHGYGIFFYMHFPELSRISGSAIETVDDYAFQSCTTLTSVNFPAVVSIGTYAFFTCTALMSVNLPSTLTTIGSNPFGECANLTNITVSVDNPHYKSEGGMLLNKAGDTLIAYPTASGNVTLNTVTSISDSAFHGCYTLISVDLPAVTSVGDWAFAWCDALTTVNLPKALSIGDYAFISSDVLITVNLPAVTFVGANAFAHCYTLTTVSLPAVTSIGAYAFGNTGYYQNLTFILPQVAPTITTGFRMDYNYSKTIIIKTPADRTGYDTDWQEKFEHTFLQPSSSR